MGTVRLYATLRQRTGVRDVEVPWGPRDTVVQVLRRLLERRPELDGFVLGEDGCLLPYVNVFLDGRDIRHLSGLETPMGNESEIAVFPPVAGGKGPHFS